MCMFFFNVNLPGVMFKPGLKLTELWYNNISVSTLIWVITNLDHSTGYKWLQLMFYVHHFELINTDLPSLAPHWPLYYPTIHLAFKAHFPLIISILNNYVTCKLFTLCFHIINEYIKQHHLFRLSFS